MEEEASSLIRRTRFSQTVCNCLDSSRSFSFHMIIHPVKNTGLNSSPGIAVLNEESTFSRNSKPSVNPHKPNGQKNPVTSNTKSASPDPETLLSDASKEAKPKRKRFSTWHPSKKVQEKGIRVKLFNKNLETKLVRNSSPHRHLKKREFAWRKWFGHSGGRVNAVSTADEFSIDMSKLFLGHRFAHGAHSKLYHGVYKDEAVAVKIIRVADDDENGALGERLKNQFVREVTLMSRLQHPNVTKFVAACKKPPAYCIITEFLSEGSLSAYLRKLDRKILPLQKQIAIALDIARGMEFIHSQGVIHRDLKPENILIDRQFHLKIADFGNAYQESSRELLADDPGTYRWMAPEMIRKKSYGRKVDVYSFGLILWQMVAGTIPYEDLNPIQAAFAVVDKNLRPVIPGDCPLAMRALIEQCWSIRPEKRPEFWQIVRVLEQFESSLAHNGTLSPVSNISCHDRKKGLLRWTHKLGQRMLVVCQCLNLNYHDTWHF